MDRSVLISNALKSDIRLSDIRGSISHHGIKGMKWGVRRSESKLATNRPPASEDVLKVDQHKATVKAGTTRALSNKELKELVDRMNLEQQYSDLLGKHKNTIDKGHNEARKILAIGDTLSKAYNMYHSPAGKALRLALGLPVSPAS